MHHLLQKKGIGKYGWGQFGLSSFRKRQKYKYKYKYKLFFFSYPEYRAASIKHGYYDPHLSLA